MIAECSLGKNSWASATIVEIMPTVISCYEYFILDGMRRIESWFWQLNKSEQVLTLNQSWVKYQIIKYPNKIQCFKYLKVFGQILFEKYYLVFGQILEYLR